MKKKQIDVVIEKVTKITERIAGKNYKGKVNPNANLTLELGFDSIKGLRMIIELERNFGVSIADLDSDINFAEYDTVEKIAHLVIDLTEKK